VPDLLPTNSYFRDQVRWLRRAARALGIEVLVELDSMRAHLRKGHALGELHPQFLTRIDGQLRYVPRFTDDATQFAGWRPDPAPVSWPTSADKLVFKRAAAQVGLLVPEYWLDDDAPRADVLVKCASGSFGEQVHGPYRSSAQRPLRHEMGEYYERFIDGDLVKVWYWGSRAVGLECDPMPTVLGDGASSIRTLVTRRARVPGVADERIARQLARSATLLAYDGGSLDDVPAPGERRRVEFRYGSDVMVQRERQLVDLRGALDACWQPLVAMGPLLQRLIPEAQHERVLYAVDAVRDRNGRLFLLEMNSNPFVNPLAYEPMLAAWLERQARETRQMREAHHGGTPDAAQGSA
jgi:hypothetical protein